MPLTPPPPPPDGLDWGNFAQLWSAGAATLAFALSIFAFFRQRNDKAIDDIKTDIKALRADDSRQFERIDKIEADLATVKSDVKHLPTVADVHEIALEQATQGEMLRGIREVCNSLAGSVKAIERALLEREAKDERR